MKEELLEPLLRRARLAKALPIIRKYPQCAFLDIGCGWEARLLRSVEPHIAYGVGIDRKAPTIRTDRLKTIAGDLEATLPFESNTFDVVSMLAVLEHLADPLRVLIEIKRVLRPNGTLILTVPSHAAKPVLEFLAFKLKLVNPAEIADHKRYFGRVDLQALSDQAGLRMLTHKYFQLGFNNFATLGRKIPAT
jgi:SAM-dependent methyltransferase